MARAVSIEEIKTPKSRGDYKTRLYRGLTHNGLPSDYEDVIVLAPGWLGSGTLHFAAASLARAGHDVAVVTHRGTSLFHPNADRSRNVHFTARAASAETGKKGVMFIGHSNGSQDIHHATEQAIERQQREPNNKNLYQVRAIGSLAGAGLSGRHLRLDGIKNEVEGTMRHTIEHPNEEIQVVGQSLLNFSRHPLLACVEGIGALICDVRSQASRFINQDNVRAYGELYMDNDGIIPLPVDRIGFDEAPGTHLTPVVDGDMPVLFAESLYNQQNLDDHSLRRFSSAA